MTHFNTKGTEKKNKNTKRIMNLKNITATTLRTQRNTVTGDKLKVTSEKNNFNKMKKINFILIFVILLFTFSIEDCLCQWVQTNGPNGGWCISMVSHNGYLFVNATGSTVFRSSDNGSNWTSVYTYSNYIDDSELSSNGQYLFIATSNSGVYRSSDNGVSWFAINNGFPYSTYPVENIVSSGQYLLCGCNSLYRSSNNGNMWESCTNGLSTSLNIYSLNVIGNKVFAATNKGAYVTTNNGSKWDSINNGFSTQRVLKISSDGTSLYAGTANGIYKSINNGAQWFSVNNGLPVDWYYDVLFDGTYILTTTLTERFRSSNGGQNWESCNNGLTTHSSERFYISGSRLFIMLRGGAGIQYTTNHGSDWIVSDNGFFGFNSDYIASQSNMIYTCAYQQGLAISSNDGASLQYIWNNLIDSYVNCVAANNNCVFISTGSKGILRTTNNGINWIKCNNGIDTLSTKIIYAYDDVLFATASYGTVIYRSTNNGNSWSSLTIPIPINSMARIGDVFIAGNKSIANPGLIRSSNKGLNWSIVGPSFIYVPSGIISKDSTFYFYNNNFDESFYKSTNFGLNWTSFLSDLNSAVDKMYVVGNKIVCISEKNIYASSNNGVNWILKNKNLPNLYGINALTVKGQNVFACIGYRGVWKISISDLIPVEKISSNIPESYLLGQNYPNPFNSVTSIKFKVTSASPYPLQRGTQVVLKVFDLMGREVRTLVDERLEAGMYEVRFDAGDLPSGIYFYRMETERYTETKKLILLK